MKSSVKVSRLWLYCAGCGYVLIGLGFATSGYENLPALVFPVVGSFTATMPSLMFAARTTVFTTDSFSSTICAGSVAGAIGLLTLGSVALIEKCPWLIWLLYVLAGNALISAVLNAPTRGQIIGPLMSVATAYAFFFSVREIHRESAKDEKPQLS